MDAAMVGEAEAAVVVVVVLVAAAMAEVVEEAADVLHPLIIEEEAVKQKLLTDPGLVLTRHVATAGIEVSVSITLRFNRKHNQNCF